MRVEVRLDEVMSVCWSKLQEGSHDLFMMGVCLTVMITVRRRFLRPKSDVGNSLDYNRLYYRVIYSQGCGFGADRIAVSLHRLLQYFLNTQFGC